MRDETESKKKPLIMAGLKFQIVALVMMKEVDKSRAVNQTVMNEVWPDL
jgi:hypothetical protein